ncbi:MAG: hypothetical protein A2171_00710 [Candidatus Levybacteria bacterium RBG_13_35_9]|nr:MAG: hypothetical protein A2171_00710 [Candidatus Levybacteria bacterium RBG_13_35_9]
MAVEIAEVKRQLHTPVEFQNLWVCQKLIRFWTDHPEWSAYETIPQLYRALHTGESHASRTNEGLSMAHVARTTDSRISGYPSNLLPDARNAYLLVGKYSDELDKLLRDKPKTMQKAIEDAAFAYYVFERIHPFPDGNGRVGRMITKTVLKSAGLKDPVFHDQRWYGQGRRSNHLQALERVGETNNLAHLELFLARSLSAMYNPQSRDFLKSRELSRIIAIKEKESKQEVQGRFLRDIWPSFGDLPLYGNSPVFKKPNGG